VTYDPLAPGVSRAVGPAGGPRSLRLSVTGAIVLLAVAVLLLALRPDGARAATPRLPDPAYLLYQPSTGDTVAQRNASQRRPIASTTKIMTALVTVGRLPLSRVVTVAPYAATPGESLAGISGGQRMRVSDLLRAMLLPSGNDAANTLALRAGGGSRAKFVRLMNQRARKMGLAHTHFANPIGLDNAENYSSPRDLLKMAEALLQVPFLRDTVNLPHYTLKTGPVGKVVVNSNTLVHTTPWVTGVKTGHTNTAGYLLVASGSRRGVPVISVVMHAPTEAARNADSLTLLKYGIGRYHRVLSVRKGRVMTTVKLTHRDKRVPLVAGGTWMQVVRHGEKTTTTLTGVPQELDGPLKAGARVGTIRVRFRGRVVALIPLRTRDAVPAATVTEVIDDEVPGGTVAIGIVLALLLGGTLWWIGARRRRRRAQLRGTSRRAREETGVA
jgi:D-alanyl-D-alanine carboxypeptidase (penicillin-binding protein 5/6)